MRSGGEEVSHAFVVGDHASETSIQDKKEKVDGAVIVELPDGELEESCRSNYRTHEAGFDGKGSLSQAELESCADSKGSMGRQDSKQMPVQESGTEEQLRLLTRYIQEVCDYSGY